MEYVCHIIIMLNIYIILVLSTNLIIGMANLLTMCQAAFYGIGAYIGTYFLMLFNLPFLLIAALVILFTGLPSFLVSYASVRLKGDYFVIATMGFQLFVYTILYNWVDITRGPYGVTNIPGIKLLGLFELSGIYAYLFFSLILMGVIVLLFHQLVRSPYGRVLRAILADEIAVKTMGRNTVLLKSLAFFLSSAVAGLAGVFYASYSGYIDPTVFTFDESIFILNALFIGGIGNIKGPILGALYVVLLPELLRFVGLPDNIAAHLRQIVYGLTLILVMYYRPQGLWGKAILK